MTRLVKCRCDRTIVNVANRSNNAWRETTRSSTNELRTLSPSRLLRLGAAWIEQGSTQQQGTIKL